MSSAPLQKAYNGKIILITGAMGYIGSALVQRPSGYQCRIIVSSLLGDLRAVTLRLANVYRPGVSVGSPNRSILNKVIAGALDGKPVSLFGEGHSTRDYIYIDAFVYAGARVEKVNGQHYYLSTETGHSVKEAFTLAVAQATAASGRKVDISHVSWPDGLSEIERRSFVADINNLRKATGWCPKVDPAEGIKRTIATFLAGGTA